MSNATKFADVFQGLQLAYGTYRVDRKQANGKNVGKASIVQEPRSAELWEGHLSGKGTGIGIIPINEDNQCVWGCIDIDQYPLDHKLLIERVRKMKLPLVVCRSKSGGAHMFLFTSDWVPAKDMQKTLNQIASALGYGGTEVFPKQIRLFLDRGDVGNFLNLPYYNADDGLRYAFNDDGSAATLDEFFALYDKHRITREQLSALTITERPDMPIPDGPPCLQHLAQQKISEGGRNNGLFNLGVYLRKAYPDSWETELMTHNMLYLDPPLPLSEVNVVAKQLTKKDYAYRCKDAAHRAVLQRRRMSDTQVRYWGGGVVVGRGQPAQVQLDPADLVFGRQRRTAGVGHRRPHGAVRVPKSLCGSAEPHAEDRGPKPVGSAD
jgi:hypothetical protein